MLGAASTLTVSVSVLSFCVFTVMVVEPAFLPVILPFLSTVAIVFFLVDQVYFGLAPLFVSGLIVADSPFPIVIDFTGKETKTGSLFTVTLQVADFLLKVVTVILTLPFFRAVTTPFSSTVAIFLLLLFQVSLLEAVFFGRVAFNVYVSVAGSVSFVSDSVILSGAFRTVTLQVPTVFFLDFTIILAEPVSLAVIRPFLSTETTDVLLEVIFAPFMPKSNVSPLPRVSLEGIFCSELPRTADPLSVTIWPSGDNSAGGVTSNSPSSRANSSNRRASSNTSGTASIS